MARRLVHPRLLLPITLIVIGTLLLGGCFFIPTFNSPVNGPPPIEKVGQAKSRKPVRVGATSREQVLTILGPPAAQTSDGRVLAYTWEVLRGIWVWPLCFMIEQRPGARTLVLRFDDGGVLQSYEVLADAPPLAPMQFGQYVNAPPMPPELGGANPDR